VQTHSQLKREVRLKGLLAINWDEEPAKVVVQWREQLEADLGGRENLTAQQLAIIDGLMIQRYFINQLDAYALRHGVINVKTGACYQLVMERSCMFSVLMKGLKLLGLHRVAKNLTSDLLLTRDLEARDEFGKTENDYLDVDGSGQGLQET
jgi:hypothetical protein